MNGKNMQTTFLEEQLYETQQALFSATSVKQIKFLQTKIEYIKQRMRDVKN